MKVPTFVCIFHDGATTAKGPDLTKEQIYVNAISR